MTLRGAGSFASAARSSCETCLTGLRSARPGESDPAGSVGVVADDSTLLSIYSRRFDRTPSRTDVSAGAGSDVTVQVVRDWTTGFGQVVTLSTHLQPEAAP